MRKVGTKIAMSNVMGGILGVLIVVAAVTAYYVGTMSVPSPATVTETETSFWPSTVIWTTTETTTTDRSVVRPIKAEASARGGVDDSDWHICRKYPIDITIEFKWKTHEWRAEGFEPDRSIGELAIDVEIKLVREGVSPIIKNGRFFVEVFNAEIGPFLILFEGPGGPLPEPKVFEPKEVREYMVNEVSFDFEFHPKKKEIELTDVDYNLEYEIEIHGEIDGRPVEVEVSYSLFPWPISIKP